MFDRRGFILYSLLMKNILLKSFIVFVLFYVTGLVPANSETLNINSVSNLVMVSEYKCRILKSDCTVDKIKYIQTGETFYDAECDASFMSKSEYESNVIQDVQSNRYNYCSRTSRTLKGAN